LPQNLERLNIFNLFIFSPNNDGLKCQSVSFTALSFIFSYGMGGRMTLCFEGLFMLQSTFNLYVICSSVVFE